MLAWVPAKREAFLCSPCKRPIQSSIPIETKNCAGLTSAGHRGLDRYVGRSAVSMAIMKCIVTILTTVALLLLDGVVTPADAQTCPTWEYVTTEITGASTINKASSATPGDVGQSVSLSFDGSSVVVGEPGFLNAGLRKGRARVYTVTDVSWVQLGPDITNNAASTADQFGTSVSIAVDGGNTYVAVGAPFATTGSLLGGLARVYKYNTSTTAWDQMGLSFNGGQFLGGLGMSVSLALFSTEVYVAIGHPSFFQTDGVVAVYVWNTATLAWQQLGSNITSTDPTFGTSVSLSVTGVSTRHLAVGTPNANSAKGYVQVYSWGGSDWVQVGSDIDGVNPNDLSGTSVSLSSAGDVVAVGEPTFSSSKGRVRVHAWNSGSSTWIARGSSGGLVGPSTTGKFGTSVSLSNDGDMLVVGAPNNASGAGLMRVFQWSSGINDYTQFGLDVAGGAGKRLGESVSISGDGVIVAATMPDSGAGSTGV